MTGSPHMRLRPGFTFLPSVFSLLLVIHGKEIPRFLCSVSHGLPATVLLPPRRDNITALVCPGCTNTAAVTWAHHCIYQLMTSATVSSSCLMSWVDLKTSSQIVCGRQISPIGPLFTSLCISLCVCVWPGVLQEEFSDVIYLSS